MSRHDEIKNAYKYLGGEASFYDGMITCSTLPGKAVCRLVWGMGKAESASGTGDWRTLSSPFYSRTDSPPDSRGTLSPAPLEVYPLGRYRCKTAAFPPPFSTICRTTCVWSLFSVASFGCVVRMSKFLLDKIFTRVIYQTLLLVINPRFCYFFYHS